MEHVGGKVVVIGAGLVGSTCAFALMNSGVASDIVLVDTDEDKAQGQALDLNHGIFFVPPVRISAGDYDDCEGADLVILTAGASQEPGQSRMDVLDKNVEVFKDIVPKVTAVNDDCAFLVVANPVDVLTCATLRISGFPRERVIGSGTALDTARFRYALSDRCGVAARNVHAYIIGEHGPSEVPVWSAVNVAGMPLDSFCCAFSTGFDAGEREGVFDRVKNAAARIIEKKGATYYAIALAVNRITEAILRDENSVHCVSSLIEGRYGISDICLSLPTVLDGGCRSRVLELPLTEEEERGLRRSAEVLSEAISKVDL
jgi:L-lactate dehydrogenase